MAQSEPIEPQYTTDEKADIGVLRVSCYIPKLKVSRKFTAKKLRPKIVKQAENADIKTNFNEDSFTLTVTGNETGVMSGTVFELNIRKLPKLIIPTESTYQVKEDRVVILLKKKVAGSWYPELEEGLDAYEEPSEDEDAEAVTNEAKNNPVEDTKKSESNMITEKMESTDKG